MAHKTIALTTELRELAFGKPLLLKAAFETSALALKSGEIEPRPPLPCEGTVNVSSGRGRLAAGRPLVSRIADGLRRGLAAAAAREEF